MVDEPKKSAFQVIGPFTSGESTDWETQFSEKHSQLLETEVTNPKDRDFGEVLRKYIAICFDDVVVKSG